MARNPRDTARDIIQGTAPSGNGPRQAREGRNLDAENNQGNRTAAPPPGPPDTGRPPYMNGYPPQPAPPPAMYGDPRIGDLQNQMNALMRQNDKDLAAEKDARRRLEDQLRQANDAIARMNQRPAQSNGPDTQQLAQELAAQRNVRAQLEAQILRMTQDIAHMKGMIDRHSSDLLALNSDVKSRPVIDPSKLGNVNQVLDQRMRDLHGEIMILRSGLDGEIGDRRKTEQATLMELQRIQALLRDQEQRRQDLIKQLGQTQESAAEAKRLNDKIQLITDEVTRNLQQKERSLRDEADVRYSTLEKAIRAEVEARLGYEKDVKQYLDTKWRTYNDELGQLRDAVEGDRTKYKDKFSKINDALAALEQQLDQGGKKLDRIMAAEIQSRKLNEKGILAKLSEAEEKINAYVLGLNRSLDDAKRGGRVNVPAPLDVDSLRREIADASSDKGKYSMEGLLKIEEKLGRIEKGLDRDVRDARDRWDTYGQGRNDMDPDTLSRVRNQIRKLDDLQDEIEKSHARMRDKVERQIPQSIEELSMKLENLRRQFAEALDQEQRERQAQIAALGRGPGPAGPAGPAGPGGPTDPSRQARDIEECQIGIKKLAESVTTVKNVLSRKIDEEARTRERDVAGLQQQLRK